MGLASKSLGTFVSKIAIFLIRFPLGILAAWYLGPEGKGVLYLLTTSIMICGVLGNFGLGTASVYFISKDRARLPVVVANLLILTASIAVIVGLTGSIFLIHKPIDMSAQLPLWVWAVAAIMVPLHLLHGFSMQVLASLLRIKEINIIDVLTAILQLLLFITFVVLMEMAMAGAFVAYAIGDVIATAGFLLFVLRQSGRPARPDFVLFMASIRFGLKDYLTNLTRHLIIRLDVFIVARLAANGVGAAGVYSVATNLAELVLFIPMSVRLGLFPMVAATNDAEASRLTSVASRHTMLLTSVSAAGIAVLGPFAITYIYGEAFTGAVLPLLILLPGVVLVSLAHIFYSDLNGRGRPGATAISALFSLAVTIVLNILLIPKYGIAGAAIASTCAYAVEFLVSGSFFVHYSKVPWCQALVFRRSDIEDYFTVLPKSFQRTISGRYG